jgi:hypothetical protein
MMVKLMSSRGWIAVLFVGSFAPACDGGGLEVTQSPTAMATGSEQESPKVEPQIAADVQAGLSRDVVVVMADESVHLRRAAFLGAIPAEHFASYLRDVKADLQGKKGRVMAALPDAAETIESYDNLPLMHVRVSSPAALAALEAQDAVVAVVEDRPMQAFDAPANLTLIGQPQVALAGKLGAGSTVAVLDTGTDYTRAPFNCTAPSSPAACPVVFAKDFAADDHAADIGSFHGTNVAGIVLSVAPAAKIVALDVFDGDVAYTTTILSAINWCIENRAKYNIVAINMSLGGGLFSKACTIDPFAPAIAAARSAGILSAVAAGNNAAANGLSTPACVAAAVSVGAAYSANVGPLFTSVCTDRTSAADKVACFSNSASFLTLLAPGVGITAAGITMSGTSQATPRVAGAIAVIASDQPGATPDAIVKRLTTSRQMVKDPRNNVTKPRLDLPAALGTTGQAAPTGKVVINGGAPYTTSASVTVDVTTTAGSATQVCLSATSTCSAWRAYAGTVPFVLPAGDGAKVVNVWWKDALSQASPAPQSASITLDTTAPRNGILTGTLMGTVAAFGWTGFTDNASGIGSYKLVSSTTTFPSSCSSGTAVYSGTATTFKTGMLPLGTTYFRLCAADKAGNMSLGITAKVTRAR